MEKNRDINEMKIQFQGIRSNYSKLYRLALEQILKEAGMYNVDVIHKALQKKGQFRITVPAPWESPFDQHIRFYPYKKNGDLSHHSCGVILDTCLNAEEIQEKYEVAI